MSNIKLFLLTGVAMIAFSFNSILCRLAFNETQIDQGSFTAIRLFSGAAFLLLIHRSNHHGDKQAGSWQAAIALFVYATAFSFAYTQLDAATGALLLFGAVQLSLIFYGVLQGERPTAYQWFGLLIAAAGVIALILPAARSPAGLASGLMVLAGIAWAAYTLFGKGETHPVAATRGNFLRTVPMLAILLVIMQDHLVWDTIGVIYALASGILASGLGYVIWYQALPRHSAISAAVVQLSVPPLTAFGGVFLLGEALSVNLLLLSAAILGGIALFIAGKRIPRSPQ